MRHLLSRVTLALLALLVLATAGCKPEALKAILPAAAEPTPAKASVMTDSVNYMYDRGLQYTLYDLSQTPPAPVGGAIDYMLATGGEKGCCISLPTTWKPGMKVRVQWQESDREKTYPEKYTRDLEIPRYDTPADLYVVFYPEHEVEVVVSVGEPGNPAWQGKIKQTPWEHCMETASRKVCKAALPKLFDAASAQGFCVFAKKKNLPNAEVNCEFAMQRCMSDYEDEPFCKKVLWGPYKK